MKTIIIISIILLILIIGSYLMISEELKYNYNSKRTLRTCKKCGNSQRLVNDEWFGNTYCKNCKL